jgi:hypothetical protein
MVDYPSSERKYDNSEDAKPRGHYFSHAVLFPHQPYVKCFVAQSIYVNYWKCSDMFLRLVLES